MFDPYGQTLWEMQHPMMGGMSYPPAPPIHGHPVSVQHYLFSQWPPHEEKPEHPTNQEDPVSMGKFLALWLSDRGPSFQQQGEASSSKRIKSVRFE